MAPFQQEGVRFSYRVAGIVMHEGRVLLHRAVVDDFWSLPGGHGEPLEPSMETLRREMREEMGVSIRVERLVWVVENFYEVDGIPHHELAFYYLMTLPPGSRFYRQDDTLTGQESGGLRLIFRWFPLEALSDLRLVPTFLRHSLTTLPEHITHIVHTDAK